MEKVNKSVKIYGWEYDKIVDAIPSRYVYKFKISLPYAFDLDVGFRVLSIESNNSNSFTNLPVKNNSKICIEEKSNNHLRIKCYNEKNYLFWKVDFYIKNGKKSFIASVF